MTHGIFHLQLLIISIQTIIFQLFGRTQYLIFSIILKIIYTLVGIKLINPFPLWYLLCFILLSFYIGKILQLKIDNYFFYILGITLLTNTPLMVNRMIFHSALSAHWLVVAGIYYYLLNRQNKYNHLNSHAVNTGLSLFIHPYIFTIVFPIYFVSLVNGFYKKNFQNIFRSILIFSSLIVFYTFGFLTNFNQVFINVQIMLSIVQSSTLSFVVNSL